MVCSPRWGLGPETGLHLWLIALRLSRGSLVVLLCGEWASPREWLEAPGVRRLEIASKLSTAPDRTLPSHTGDLKYPLSMVVELSRGGCVESPDVCVEGSSTHFPSRLRFLQFTGFLGRRCRSLQSTARWLIINIQCLHQGQPRITPDRAGL